MRQQIDKLATLILRFIIPALCFLIPIFFLPITPSFFEYNKTYLIFVLATLSLLAWTVRTITRRRIHFTVSPAAFPLLIVAAIYVLSSLLQSPNPYMSLINRTALVVSLTIIFFSVSTSQKNQDVVKYSLYGLAGGALFSSLFCLLQYFGVTYQIAPVDYFKDKIFNLNGGPLPQIIFNLIFLAPGLYLTAKSKNIADRLIFGFVTVFSFANILLQINIIATSGQKFVWPFLPFSIGYAMAIEVFKNIRTLLLGTGPETFLSTFTQLRPAFLNASPNWNIRYLTSSNELFDIITTTGLVSGVFWAMAFISSLTKASPYKKHKTQLSESSTLSTGSWILLAILAITNLVIPASPVILSLTYAALTLVTISLKLNSDDSTSDVNINILAVSNNSPQTNYEDVGKQNTPVNQFLIWLFALPSLVLIGYFWYFAARGYSASMATFKAIKSLNSNATESYSQQVRAYNLDPKNPTYRINFSQTSLALANSISSKKDLNDQDKTNISQLVQQAIREAKNATALNPRSVVGWENLANTYSQLINFAEGATDWTIASYNQAILLDPSNPSLRLNLGGVYLNLKDYDNASRFFSQAAELKPNWPNAHYNLSHAYQAAKNYTKALSEMRIVVQLVDPNSTDYQKAQDELKELEKQVPSATGKTPSPTATNPANPNIELATPTPIVSPATKITLPEGSGPEISPSVPSPTSSPTPKP